MVCSFSTAMKHPPPETYETHLCFIPAFHTYETQCCFIPVFHTRVSYPCFISMFFACRERPIGTYSRQVDDITIVTLLLACCLVVALQRSAHFCRTAHVIKTLTWGERSLALHLSRSPRHPTPGGVLSRARMYRTTCVSRV